MPHRPLDRQAALDAVDALILHALAVKRVIEGIVEDDGSPGVDFCPDSPDGRHLVVWTMAGPGMCSHCGLEVERVEVPGVSGPDGGEQRP